MHPLKNGDAMKLIIQIPCLNEEKALPQVISDLPKSIPGIDVIEYLVIDDGSDDRTADIARELGVHHVVSLGSNRGLATAFRIGIETAVRNGADIVVNTDGDNQYCGEDIPKLVEPIIRGTADVVVGCRPILAHPEFGFVKKTLQIVGSFVLRLLSKTSVKDAASGFRAFSREACQRIFIHTSFSYCMETLIQAGNNRLRVESVDIRVNPKTRDSRLFKSMPHYLWKSGMTMSSMFVLYQPGKFFVSAALPMLFGALLLGFRFVYLIYFDLNHDPTRTHLPSLILMSVLAVFGVLLGFLGVLAELVKAQRRLTEEILYLERVYNSPTEMKVEAKDRDFGLSPEGSIGSRRLKIRRQSIQ